MSRSYVGPLSPRCSAVSHTTSASSVSSSSSSTSNSSGAARAAPLLFEVLLLLDETDEAEVVWDTALHRGESGPTYERLIAVALRCGEGGAGEPLGESDKRTEGDSERR